MTLAAWDVRLERSAEKIPTHCDRKYFRGCFSHSKICSRRSFARARSASPTEGDIMQLMSDVPRTA